MGIARRSGRTTIALVGPAPPSRGGIATAVESIRSSPQLGTRYRFVLVRTYVEGGPGRKALRALGALARLAALVLLRRVDLVHVHSASGGSFRRKAAATLIARLAGAPVLFHVHGGAFHRQLDRPGVRGRLLRFAVRRVLAQADAVAVLTEGWARELGRRLDGRILRVVPNGVTLPAAPLARPPEPGLVAFLGDLRPEKGVLELVAALALLRARGVEARAVLAGEGASRVELERRARELGLPEGAVELPGWLEADRKEALLERAACFCLPSHEEGLPLALLEAMAAGKAIVAAEAGGMPEAARPGREALIVPPRDAVGLADALERVLTDRDLRRSLGAAARERARAEYGEPAVAARLGALYAEIVARRGRSIAAAELRRA